MTHTVFPTPPGQIQTDFGLPVGSVISFAGELGPIGAWGWLLCDGTSLKKVEYPELFAALGGLYGEDQETFNLPDFRGQFLRGVSSDSASTEDRQPATQNGQANGVGSTQKDALQTHEHTYDMAQTSSAMGGPGTAAIAVKSQHTSAPVTTQGKPVAVKISDIETRPTNVFVYYLIKFTYAVQPQFQA